MKRTRNLALLLSVLMLLSLLAGCGGSPSAPPASGNQPSVTDPSGGSDGGDTSSIRIGVINPQSGNLAITGTDDQTGILLAIDMFNERGGVNGRMIEPVTADIPDAATAQTEINRLIQQEKLSLITGCYGSSIVEVVASICDRNNVFYWENVSVLDRLTEQGYTNVFRLHISGSKYGEEAASLAVDMAEKMGIAKEDLKLGALSENGDFGQSISVGINRYCEANGITLVLDELYDATTTDATPLVLKMKDANPDVVIATSYINDGIEITRKMKALNYTPPCFLGLGSGYGAAAYPEALGPDAETMMDLDPTNAPVLENLDPEMSELAKDFAGRFEKERGYAPTTVGYLAWQATWVLLNNVVTAVDGDVANVEGLVQAAKAIDIPVGTLPTGYGVKFGDNGQNDRCVIAIMQWKDGQLITVYPDNLANAEIVDLPRAQWTER